MKMARTSLTGMETSSGKLNGCFDLNNLIPILSVCVLEPQLLPFFFNLNQKQSRQNSIKIDLKLPI